MLETKQDQGYGSFVIHSLVDKLHPRIDAVKARVKAAHPQLSESKFSHFDSTACELMWL